MEKSLQETSSEENQKKFLNFFQKINKERVLDHDEFLEILNHALKLNAINIETRDRIAKTLETEYIKSVFKIFSLSMTFGGALTLIVGGGGIVEIIPKVWNNEMSFSEGFTSNTALLYYSKLIFTAMIPYIIWIKSDVKHKTLKSITNGFPAIGSWVFPFLAMLDQKTFYKFWKIYGKTKNDYRKTIKGEDHEQDFDEFNEKLIKLCAKSFDKK